MKLLAQVGNLATRIILDVWSDSLHIIATGILISFPLVADCADVSDSFVCHKRFCLQGVLCDFRAWQLFDWVRALPEDNVLQKLCDSNTYTTMISLCGPWQQVRRALSLVADMRARSLECGIQASHQTVRISAFRNDDKSFSNMNQRPEDKNRGYIVQSFW